MSNLILSSTRYDNLLSAALSVWAKLMISGTFSAHYLLQKLVILPCVFHEQVNLSGAFGFSHAFSDIFFKSPLSITEIGPEPLGYRDRCEGTQARSVEHY